jgi:hypothetical protein
MRLITILKLTLSSYLVFVLQKLGNGPGQVTNLVVYSLLRRCSGMDGVVVMCASKITEPTSSSSKLFARQPRATRQ